MPEPQLDTPWSWWKWALLSGCVILLILFIVWGRQNHDRLVEECIRDGGTAAECNEKYTGDYVDMVWF